MQYTAQRLPDHPAIAFPESRQTYSQLRQATDRWAGRLIGLDIEPGQHVGLSMTNSPDFIELLFAICSIGAVAVPFNPRYRSSELAHVVENSDVSVVVVGNPPVRDVDLLARLAEALPGLNNHNTDSPLHLPEAPRLRRVVALGPQAPAGTLTPEKIDATLQEVTTEELHERYARTRVRDPALIMYTSGTTARPKGAVLSHEAFLRTAISLASGRYHLTPDDRMWDPLPLFHMSGLLPLMASIYAGSTFLCMPRVDAVRGIQTMREEKATVAFVAFAQLAMDLIASPGYQESDLQHLRIIHTGGVPEVLTKVQAAFPNAVLVNPYGCTEAGGMCATSELGDTPEQRTVFSGRPYPGLEIRVVDGNNHPVPTGTSGEIVVRGYSLFDGYYRNPEATAAAMDAEGWFHTGDLGELDGDGRVRYISRLKDMLKVGGENVACVEIENLLCSHHDVAVAAVIGVPDERLGEVPVAYVELIAGATLTERELISYCTGKIARFKVPAHIRFVKEWPMSATKIKKDVLRQRWDTSRDASAHTP